MKENKRNASLLIISLLFLIWLIGSICLSVYEAKSGKTWLFLIILGQFFTIMGMIAIMAIVAEKQNGWWLGSIFVLAGTSCIIYGLMSKLGPKDVFDKMVNAIPLIAGITFTIVGGFVLIYCHISAKKLRKICTYEISGKCIDFKSSGSGYKKTQCPIYEVFYNGERMLLDKNIFTRALKNPAMGETRQLFISLDDVNKITDSNFSPREEIRISRYIDEKTDKAVAIFSNILFGSFLIGGCILTVASCIFIPIF